MQSRIQDEMIQGIPSWLFFLAAAVVMVVSFVALTFSGRRAGTSVGYRTYDLLALPPVRWALGSRKFHWAAQATTAFLFLFIIVAGLFGQQQAGSNIATVLTWTYWWILLVLFVMLCGKAWCYVCPWDALASWLERLSLWGVRRGLSAQRRWPRAARNLYPAVLLFLALTWLELGYGVTVRPEMTALLGLLMFFLAFVTALVFERRSFCRYGCLIGRISGLYALFASVEIRSRDATICRTACGTRDCYHGNERGYPCPTFQYLGALSKNTYCISCLECLHTCPHDNVAVNLRTFGHDMVKLRQVRFDEAVMVIVMLAMTTFHGLTMTPTWGTLLETLQDRIGLPYPAAFSIGMVGLLAALMLAYVVLVSISHLMARDRSITMRQLGIRYAYALLPIALFYHLAHNAMHFFIEGGTLVPLLSDPLGWHWNLLGTAAMRPGPLLPFSVVWALMVGLILIGHIWSLAAGHRLASQIFRDDRATLRSQIPLLVAMVGYSILSLWIVAQPMQMRTAM